MEFAARYQDGQVAEIRDVYCGIAPDAAPPALDIRDAETGEPLDSWPRDDCYLLHSRAMELRIANMQRSDGARLAVKGREPMRRALRSLPSLGRHLRRDGWTQLRILTFATLALASVIVVYLVGIPLLSDRLVSYFPTAWEEKVGATADAQIEATLTGGAGYELCDPDPQSLANRAIARFVEAAFAGLPTPFAPRVAVISSDVPNAFALPGGRTYAMSALIQASRTPDEFAGVLAHELGHVHYRHGMQTLIATSSTGLLVGFILGDLTGLSVAGAVGASLIDTRFSRQAEREADAFAAQTAQRLGFSTIGLVDLLDRIAADDALARAFALFSNHPLTADRRAALERLAVAPGPGAAPFTAEEWRAIKALCPPPPPPGLPPYVSTGPT